MARGLKRDKDFFKMPLSDFSVSSLVLLTKMIKKVHLSTFCVRSALLYV